MRHHPWVTLYVLGMVLAAIYTRFTSGIEWRKGAAPIDLRTPFALLTGILWPFGVLFLLAIQVFGQSRVSRLVDRVGVVESYWSPHGMDLRIPGIPEDYPKVPDGSKIRDGRRVGQWGLLLLHDLRDDGKWHCAAKRIGSDEIAVEQHDSEASARYSFRWTREDDLDAALATYRRMAEDEDEEIPSWP